MERQSLNPHVYIRLCLDTPIGRQISLFFLLIKHFHFGWYEYENLANEQQRRRKQTWCEVAGICIFQRWIQRQQQKFLWTSWPANRTVSHGALHQMNPQTGLMSPSRRHYSSLGSDFLFKMFCPLPGFFNRGIVARQWVNTPYWFSI